MSDRLVALRLFARVARLWQFFRRRPRHEHPQPTVSPVVAWLEKDLGAALFTRTTRALSLTDAGVDFLNRIEPILADLEEAEHAVRGSSELRGVLRVGLSSSVALREIAPRLPTFMSRHPKLRIELITNDQRQDFVSEGVDVGLRFGPLTDSTATAKKMTVQKRAIFAAPSYLAQAGVPRHPADIAHHSIIAGPSKPGRAWTFKKGGKVETVKINGRLSVTFNEVALAAAVSGLGIVSMTLGAARKELGEGSLVRVLADWDMGDIELHAVFPAGKATKPSARAFIEFLSAEFALDPGLRLGTTSRTNR